MVARIGVFNAISNGDFMRKTLLTLSLALTLSAGAAAVALAAGISTPSTPATATGKPVMLAQVNVTPERRPGGRMGRGLPPTPEQRAARRPEACKEIGARAAGRLAYLEARLELTANQRAAFNRWREERLAAAGRHAAACASRPASQGRGAANAETARPSPVERLARQEQALRQRLSDITAERPALEALYNSLTPEQREKFTPASGLRRGMGRGPMRERVAAMRDRMGGPRSPMGGGMRRPMGAPPPAPPQAQ